MKVWVEIFATKQKQKADIKRLKIKLGFTFATEIEVFQHERNMEYLKKLLSLTVARKHGLFQLHANNLCGFCFLSVGIWLTNLKRKSFA